MIVQVVPRLRLSALVVNPAKAETVRRIFVLYRELGCVRRVKQKADCLGLRMKCSTTANGTERGGKPFSCGHLYTLLSNPIYTGQIAHKDQLYPGQHPALIDADSWAAVVRPACPATRFGNCSVRRLVWQQRSVAHRENGQSSFASSSRRSSSMRRRS
jgi:hypothetical protein